jgi:hypothetical protein
MTTLVTEEIPLDHWPANATVAFLLDDGTSVHELVLTDDGDAFFAEERFTITDQVRVAERRSGLAALRAGRI